MANAKSAIESLLIFEGVLSDHPEDRGGLTKWGISQRQYPHLDIANLKYDQMLAIYRADYWNPLSLDLVRIQTVAEEIFEQAVNFGAGIAARHTQKAINYLIREDIKIDGDVGPKTLRVVNDCKHPSALLQLLNGLQLKRYIEIVDVDPTQEVFVRGWLRRVEMARLEEIKKAA